MKMQCTYGPNLVYETVTASSVGIYSEQEVTCCFIARRKGYAKTDHSV